MFSFYPKSSGTGSRKTSINLEWLVVESCATPLIIRYTLSFQWPDFGLNCLVAVKPKGHPPKFKASV